METRLTWDEIKIKYPNQLVGLVDVDWKDSSNVKSAIVKYHGTELTKDEWYLKAFRGEICKIFTGNNLHLGALTTR